ncbi:hypothetical protein A2415_01560 [candidate division WWE3 bacterium RIFOXYC1_FULL_39_7]|uniref:Uncharacterized protein n=2 Tax=Katanobacteria TaxID=422282 RepID=A0A1F4X533_UNCKA|nr:MAG: hypothetical protein A2415_01560 [candidate division WWE3 bacterium RIFOXYC1_FULL_39_7]OGC76788.1 MAG: hypothetical protein A2619_00485 [candidate division WWE3 bacterium RIFOXYD1_FULL_39_9]
MKPTTHETQELILQMRDIDQKLRSESPIDWDKLTKIDAENTTKIKGLIAKYSLIDVERFGKEVSQAAWLIVQHAPRTEVDFMKSYLDIMRKNTSKVIMRNLAYLEDRVNMYTDLPQVYGTQVISKDGKMEFYKIEDVSKVDECRNEVGLNPLKEYAEKFTPPIDLPKDYR